MIEKTHRFKRGSIKPHRPLVVLPIPKVGDFSESFRIMFMPNCWYPGNSSRTIHRLLGYGTKTVLPNNPNTVVGWSPDNQVPGCIDLFVGHFSVVLGEYVYDPVASVQEAQIFNVNAKIKRNAFVYRINTGGLDRGAINNRYWVDRGVWTFFHGPSFSQDFRSPQDMEIIIQKQ